MSPELIRAIEQARHDLNCSIIYVRIKLCFLHFRQSGMATVNANFYYTTQFRLRTPDPVGYIRNQVTEINAGYQNSNIDLRVNAWCIQEINFAESGSPGNMLDRFITSRG